ncbi:MAG: hypothetical protein A3C35_01830 [Omnitrophica bacterium RIFCSPHIGHO2_02_FULL_46_11]|nr:MAG: hypothetical protein A3C35_01830 [Omnitrophica bacterium RIFCSPHIGHO2_02_FULL_46_11]OGW87497.1 MAG: hypothetical protein A3A81_03970 [Omnitrophica bacterium RIFCSPLOWO2_01_FULL_45_10b]
MKTEDVVPQPDRREFLRKLPRHFLEKFGAVAREGILAFSSRTEEIGLPRDLVAQVEVSRCLAWSGLICQQCYLACPKREQAIEMRDQKPIITVSICDGCAMCVSACETVNDLPAIRMVSRVPASIVNAAEKEVTS